MRKFWMKVQPVTFNLFKANQGCIEVGEIKNHLAEFCGMVAV